MTMKEGAELPGGQRGLAAASLWRAFSCWRRSWLLSATCPASPSYWALPAAGLGWSGISFSVSKQSASGQRHAIKDMPVFWAQVTFGRPTSSSGSRHCQKVALHRKTHRRVGVHGTRSQLDFPDHASVHLEPPGYYIPLWGNKSSVTPATNWSDTQVKGVSLSWFPETGFLDYELFLGGIAFPAFDKRNNNVDSKG